MNCNAVPYEGKEKFVFISYCHVDMGKVYPIVEQLARAGCRIWYDKGIDAGAEWPDVIAQHLLSCELCIIFLSQAYAGSNNCRQEQTYAVLKGKKILCIQLEETKLSLGMEMQLSRSQHIQWNKDDSDTFINNVLASENIRDCIGDKNDKIVVQSYQDTETVSSTVVGSTPIPAVEKKMVDPSTVLTTKEERTKNDLSNSVDESVKSMESSADLSLEINKKVSNKNVTVLESGGKTELEYEQYRVLLVDWVTGTYTVSTSVDTQIGKQKGSELQIGEQYANISHKHCQIIAHEGQYYIRDLNSQKGTWLNGIHLEPNSLARLDEINLVSLGSVEGLKYIIIIGEFAEIIESAGEIVALLSQEYGGALFLKNTNTIGREEEWPCGAMNSERISRVHAIIEKQNDKWLFTDCSTNGSYLDGKHLRKTTVELKNNMMIRMGGEHFLFHRIILQKTVQDDMDLLNVAGGYKQGAFDQEILQNERIYRRRRHR